MKTFQWRYFIFAFFILPWTELKALELDWSGQFWTDLNIVANYTLDAGSADTVDEVRENAGGYYIAPAGSHTAKFGSLFMRLRPKLVVNDSVYVKSELWLGNPAFSLLGDGIPYVSEQKQLSSSMVRGSFVTAQRLYAELLSDVGTIQIGRFPIHFGLGVVWNEGEDLFSRFMSTADGIRWLARFGAFSFVPSFMIRSSGNCVGGGCQLINNSFQATGGLGQVYDGSLIMKYQNPDEQIETGVNLIKRFSYLGQPSTSALVGPISDNALYSQSSDANYLIWDLFFEKKFSQLRIAAEAPIMAGKFSGLDMSSFGVALEMNLWLDSIWSLGVKTGVASGQRSTSSLPEEYQFFYFHPNYQIANILFRYQLGYFSMAQSRNDVNSTDDQLHSIYANPITNAFYFSFAPEWRVSSRWTLLPSLTWARALAVARAGQYTLNTVQYTVFQNQTAADQFSNLGMELDLNAIFYWSESCHLMFENGIFFPGRFYAFDNVSSNVRVNTPVLASSIRFGVVF